MRTLISLAVRSLTRHKARNAITAGAVLFGVLMSVFLASYLKGMQDSIIADAIDARIGAIQVHRAGYFDLKENQPLKLDLPEDGEFEARIRAVVGVRAVAARILFTGLVSNGTSSTLFVGQAIDPKQEREVLPKAAADVRGESLSESRPDGAIVGSELAAALDAAPGASLVLQATTQRGQENALEADVVGTLDPGTMLESKRMIGVPLRFAQRLLRMEGRVTEYVVAVERLDDVDVVAARLRAALGGGYEVQTWSELRPAIADVIAMQNSMLSIVAAACLFIAVFGVVNTLLMSVMERTREIGTMIAVGMRQAQIAALFLLEALVLVVLGGAAGLGAAWTWVSAIALRGGFLMKPAGGTMAMQVVPAVPWHWVAVAVTAALVAAVTAALIPAIKAARLNPVDALRAN